jgi:hypothetical protein
VLLPHPFALVTVLVRPLEVWPLLAPVTATGRRRQRSILRGDDADQRQRGQQPEQATARRLGGEGARETIEGESIHWGSLVFLAMAPGTQR